MTDTNAPIDEKRPWITDPADDPSRMNWFTVFFSPFGETSRLHFTRAWTVLFFGRVSFNVISNVLTMIAPALGAMIFPSWAWLAFYFLTAIMSFFLHMGRFASARRNPLWAVIVLIPMFAASAGFIVGAQGASQQYTAQVERMEEGRNAGRAVESAPESDSASAGESEADSAASDSEDTAEDAAEGGGESGQEQRQGRQQGRGGPQLNPSETSQLEFAVAAGSGFAYMMWLLPAFLTMLWSLLWVARLPNGGGTIRSRFETDPDQFN